MCLNSVSQYELNLLGKGRGIHSLACLYRIPAPINSCKQAVIRPHLRMNATFHSESFCALYHGFTHASYRKVVGNETIPSTTSREFRLYKDLESTPQTSLFLSSSSSSSLQPHSLKPSSLLRRAVFQTKPPFSLLFKKKKKGTFVHFSNQSKCNSPPLFLLSLPPQLLCPTLALFPPRTTRLAASKAFGPSATL